MCYLLVYRWLRKRRSPATGIAANRITMNCREVPDETSGNLDRVGRAFESNLPNPLLECIHGRLVRFDADLTQL